VGVALRSGAAAATTPVRAAAARARPSRSASRMVRAGTQSASDAVAIADAASYACSNCESA